MDMEPSTGILRESGNHKIDDEKMHGQGSMTYVCIGKRRRESDESMIVR